MDRTLLKAYIRTVIEEVVESEVRKILPNLLGEAIAEIKNMKQITETSQTTSKPKLDRSKLAALMGLERVGDTISATTDNMRPLVDVPPQLPPTDPAVVAVTKNYSEMMKAMGLTK